MTKPSTRGSAQQASASSNTASQDALAALHVGRSPDTAAAATKRQTPRVSTLRSYFAYVLRL